MNKLFVILLAVCLVSVHAFVKRDAPAEPPKQNNLANIQAEVSDFLKSLETNIKGFVNPEAIKQHFNSIVDQFAQSGSNKPSEKKE